MLLLRSRIEIIHENQKIVFTHVNDVSVVTSTEQLTDTCVVKLPRCEKFEQTDVTNYIRRGDKISVRLGYDDELETVFKGYVKSVSTTVPLTLECENEAYVLKRISVPAQTFEHFDVQVFCKQYLKGYEQHVTELPIGKFTLIEEMTVLEVLDHLKSNYSCNFFFREGVFYGVMGLFNITKNNSSNTIKFDFGRNVVSSSLKLALKEDVKIQLVAKNVLLNNKKIEVKIPELKGENYSIRTVYIPEAQTEKELKELAKEKYDELNKDKMEGSITAFGVPYVRKADVVHLLDEHAKEQNNKMFFVKGVTYTFNQAGYRQVISLGGVVKS